MIVNPALKYQMLQQTNPEALAYDNLIQYTENKQGWRIPKPSPNGLTQEKPSEYIKRSLEEHGCIKAWVATSIKIPGQLILQLQFASVQKAENFKKNHCTGDIEISRDHKTVGLNPNRAAEILTELGLSHFGHTNPIPIIDALKIEHDRPFGFFNHSKGSNTLEQLIKVLEEIPEENSSFFHQSLILRLKELPANNPSLVLTKIKEFAHVFSSHTSEKKQNAKILQELILHPDTKNLSDLIEKLNTTSAPSP